MSHIFISYSRADTAITEKLAELLSQAFSHVWYDKRLAGGEEWWNAILNEIEKSSHFIFLISAEALTSEYCLKELAEARKLNKHIIPVVVRNHSNVPAEELQGLQTIFMPNGITVDNLNELYTALIHRSESSTPSTDLKKKKELADIKLLEKLWPAINSQKIQELNSMTQSHLIERSFSRAIRKYLQSRDLSRNPHHKFYNEYLEKAFLTFDRALNEYEDSINVGFCMDDDDSERLISNYLDTKKHYRFGDKESILRLKLAEYNRSVDAILDVQKVHIALVEVIRKLFPDFDFEEEATYE